MSLRTLLAQANTHDVSAGLIGAGAFGVSLLAQAQRTPGLRVEVVCDKDMERATHACRLAGLPPEQIRWCGTRAEVEAALGRGAVAVVDDARLALMSPVEIIVESTGDPEAGATHGLEAIAQGKHVAMVTKETDVVVGPILRRLAAEARLVYTPVAGDQHGLLIEMVAGVQLLGLEIIAAGKARHSDFVLDEQRRSVGDGEGRVHLADAAWPVLERMPQARVGEIVAERRRLLARLPLISDADLCEMTIVANAAGLNPDVPSLHHPVLRTVEIPSALNLIPNGGLLARTGAVEVVTCLRRADEPGLGGGVFVVAQLHNDHTRQFLKAKGLLFSDDGAAGLIYRPYHLLGVETPLSLLKVGLWGESVLDGAYRQRFDLAARARRDLPAGTRIRGDHTGGASTDLEPLMLPSSGRGPGRPVPLYLAHGHRLVGEVKAGAVLTYDRIEPAPDSPLWALRRRQEGTMRTGRADPSGANP